MERYKFNSPFEAQIRAAFDNAEILPSLEIWENIEGSLDNSSKGGRKSGLTLFQLVAAVTLLFAASVPLWDYIKQNDTISPTYEGSEQAVGGQTNQAGQDGNEVTVLPDRPDEGGAGLPDSKEKLVVSEPSKTSDPMATDKEEQLSTIDQKQESQDELIFRYLAVARRGPEVDRPDFAEPDPYMIPAWTPDIISNETPRSTWAKAGFSTGSYKAATPIGFGTSFAEAMDPATAANDGFGLDVSSTDKPGFSYGAGIGVGAKIGRKWILETGLNYMYSELPANTNTVIESGNSIYPVFHETQLYGDLLNVPNYQVTNSFKFLTIPVRAGYQIIDKKIGWLATGGFSSNILLNSTIQSDSYQELRLSGNQSPYRPLSWSALIGTEVYFNFATYYQFSVIPQYSIGLTDLTKPDSNFSIVPNSFNIGISLRYLIR